MLILIYICLGLLVVYLLATLILTYVVHQVPRKPINAKPDWGIITDTKIAAIDGGYLKAWRVEPESPSRGIVVFAHGWGRNRGRMVARARIFGKLSFTTILYSARDHGSSSPRRFMNALKFAEDIEAVLNWVGVPVILYGHSAGAGGAIIAAARNSGRIKLLFLEGSFAYTREALLNLYRWYNNFFGTFFGPMILFWMNLLYKKGIDSISPARLAPKITIPVMLIHGEKDRRFPLSYALTLQGRFPGGTELFVAKGSNHSDSSKATAYPDAVKSFLDSHLSCRIKADIPLQGDRRERH